MGEMHPQQGLEVWAGDLFVWTNLLLDQGKQGVKGEHGRDNYIYRERERRERKREGEHERIWKRG